MINLKNNNLIGRTINNWTVLKNTKQKNNNGNYLCLAQCKCGTERLVSASAIRTGKSKSCGCIAINKHKQRKQHGITDHPLYPRWMAMKRRCYTESDSRYKYYGARGVYMCDEWKNNPKLFYAWFASQSDDLSLTVDRIDTCGPYSPENCRLITLTEQQKNRRKRKGSLPDNVVIDIKNRLRNGERVTAISKHFDISHSTVSNIKSNKIFKDIN